MKRATAVRLAAVGGVTAALASLTTAHAGVEGGSGRGGSGWGPTYVATSSIGWVDVSSVATLETVQIAVTVEDLSNNTVVVSRTTSSDSGPVTNFCTWAEVPGDTYQISITNTVNGIVWAYSG